jgi:uncharacterized protein YutE (UPF0331/DUF86 family)
MDSLHEDLKEKLVHLATYLDELESWLNDDSVMSGGKGGQRILERMTQLVVECLADTGDLWLDVKGFPAGESVRGVFERLREEGLIDEEEVLRFGEYASLRNRIVHDYERILFPLLAKKAPALLTDGRTLSRRLAENTPGGDRLR